MADAWRKESGVRITRQAIAEKIRRLGLTPGRTRDRYDDVLPWQVRAEHNDDMAAKRLRREGRRRRGLKNDPGQQKLLEQWKRDLEGEDSVVSYDPERGFRYVYRNHDTDFDLIDEESLPLDVRDRRRREWKATQSTEGELDLNDPRIARVMELEGFSREERLEMARVVQEGDRRRNGGGRPRTG